MFLLMKYREAEFVAKSNIHNLQSVGVDMHNLKVGFETWFVERVGLHDWGIDPLRDLNHVKNEVLLEVFEEKIPNKGYSIFKCKLDNVKEQMVELYSSFV